MKAQLISSMTSFVLGTGATLVALSSWLGTTDLQTIRTSVQNYIVESEQHSSALAQDYQVTVNNANAEIGEYKDALAQANSNISQLITAYNNAETEHQTKVSNLQKELTSANSKYETDLAELQTKLADMETRLDSQYEKDMNAKIKEANAIIEQANKEVKETKENVLADLKTSQVDEIVANAEKLKDQLNTGNDKSVTSIEDIVPSEQQGE